MGIALPVVGEKLRAGAEREKMRIMRSAEHIRAVA